MQQDDRITIIEYIDIRIAELEKRIEISRRTMEKRLDGMNEFRAALRDQAERSPTRQEIKALEREIQDLRSYRDRLEGVASQKDVFNVRAVAWIGIGLSVVGIIIAFLLQ